MRHDEIPQPLLEAIKEGTCVAFVGAGFVAPALPDWDRLLHSIAEDDRIKENPKLSEQIRGLLKGANDPRRGIFDREAAAQILESNLKDRFGEVVQTALDTDEPKGLEMVNKRISTLYEIPFQAVLTTNFDNLLPGDPGNAKSYHAALRGKRERWFDPNFVVWRSEARNKLSRTPTIKLHGQLANDGRPSTSVVLSRSGYRRLLFENSGYSNFLRSIMATRTILFMGFSFSDTYLNLIRSEVLSFLHYKGSEIPPLAYAILADVGEEEQNFLLEYEGIQALTYEKRDPDPKSPDRYLSHKGFDDYLEKIRELTAPVEIIRGLLSEKRVLWMDPAPFNNEYGFEVLTGSENGGPRIERATSPQEAIRKLIEAQDGSDPYHLVLSHWGYRRGEAANGDDLLQNMRKAELRAPVIIFAAPSEHVDENRTIALGLGAFEYTWQWEQLFAAIERLFTRAPLRSKGW